MTVRVVTVGEHQVQVVPVGSADHDPTVVGVGVPRPSLAHLTDVAGTAAAPIDTPLLWRKGSDGVFRPEEFTAGETVPALGGFETVVTLPTLLVQIVHGLPWKPAGVTSVDDAGNPTEYALITHPSAGITEVTFGGPFTGRIYLS